MTDRHRDRQTEWNDSKAHSLRCERDAAVDAALTSVVTMTSYNQSSVLHHNGLAGLVEGRVVGGRCVCAASEQHLSAGLAAVHSSWHSLVR